MDYCKMGGKRSLKVLAILFPILIPTLLECKMKTLAEPLHTIDNENHIVQLQPQPQPKSLKSQGGEQEGMGIGEGGDVDKCGGVLLAFNGFHTLSYKWQKPYQQWESCIWTIHAPNRTIIKLNFETYFYQTNSYDYLSVGFFQKSKYDSLDSLVWIKLPTSITPQPLDVPGPVAFIHFVSTYQHPTLGFRMTYEAGGDYKNFLYNYDNYFLGGEYGTFQYPAEGRKYGSNQRTTIVLKAQSGLPIKGNPVPSYLYIRNLGMQDSMKCQLDGLNVYGFGEEGDTWYKNRTLCGSSPSSSGVYIYHPRNDPIIITFKSGGNGDGNGFELFWRNLFTS